MLKTTDGTQYKRIPGLPGDRMPTTGFQKKRALYTATGGETTINLALLSPSLSCIPGMNQIAIKRSSGGSLIAGVDFYETNPTTITFPSGDPLIAGEIVEISQEVMITGIAALTARPDCYTATATAGQTSVICDFSWPYNLNSGKAVGGVSLYINGVLQTRGVDFTEVNLGTANTNQIDLSLGGPLVGGENIIALPTYQSIDTSAAASSFYGSAYSGMQSMLAAGSQSFVDQSTDMITAPNSTIVGRAKIPNLTNDLRASLGIERIMTQQIVQLQNEFGPSGEPVFAAVNDDRGLIRFVGAGWTVYTDDYGTRAQTGVVGDYMEVTFYGTGLNLLWFNHVARSLSYSLDGNSPVTLITAGTAYSQIISNRNYASNQPLSIAQGLQLGIHTVKINVTAHSMTSYGIEVLNANASSYININTGMAYINGAKIVKNAISSITYNTGITGVKGGRVVRYLNADSTVGQVFTATNASQGNLTLADHSNEEVARVYHWREFGAGRSDDFSSDFGAGSTKAFTLDDGTTTLTGSTLGYTGTQLYCSNTNGVINFTFIGTGLDIFEMCGGTTIDQHTFYIDGSSIGSSSSGSTNGIRKIVSGLPYGTHTFRVKRDNNLSNAFAVKQFIVYQPKKPTIPSASLELCDYNVMADYSLVTSIGTFGALSAGVMRKMATRELIYTGAAWQTPSINAAFMSGFGIYANATSNYVEYTFFGTGFNARMNIGNTAYNFTYSIGVNGGALSGNLSSYTSNFVYTGSGLSYDNTTGTISGTSTGAVGNDGGVFHLSGLPLGVHKVRFAINNAQATYIDGIDVITPIHSHKTNSYITFQNTLSVGSNGVLDTRRVLPLNGDRPSQKAWVQAVGVANGPFTSSATPVPVPDMSVTIKTNGGPIEISYSNNAAQDTAGQSFRGHIYLNGVQVSKTKVVQSAASYQMMNTDSMIIPVSAGYHKVDLYWSVSSGTVTCQGDSRILTVKEL